MTIFQTCCSLGGILIDTVSVEVEIDLIKLGFDSLQVLLMLLLGILQLALLQAQALFFPLDETELHCVVFVLAGLEAEKEGVLAKGLAQACIVR